MIAGGVRGLQRSACLVAALICAVALVACGGDDGGTDVDALTGCLEDAGLDVERGEVDDQDAADGLTDQLSVSDPAESDSEGIDIGVQVGVFGSSDEAQKYVSEFSGNLEQVGSVLIFALDTDTEAYQQTVSCAEEETG